MTTQMTRTGSSNSEPSRPGSDLVSFFLPLVECELRVPKHSIATRHEEDQDAYDTATPSDCVLLSPPPLVFVQVGDSLLPHSFNLNPAIMSAVELEMAEGVAETMTTVGREGAPMS